MPLILQDVMHSTILGTCFYSLGDAFGKQYGALLAIAYATTMTLVRTYFGGNMIAFIGCLLVTVVGGCAFCVAAVVQIRGIGRAVRASYSCKLFPVVSVCRSLLVICSSTFLDNSDSEIDAQARIRLSNAYRNLEYRAGPARSLLLDVIPTPYHGSLASWSRRRNREPVPCRVLQSCIG